MTLGKKISDLRNLHNMSQIDLAEKMNVSRQSVSKWETDASIPDLDKLIMLSEIFNVTIDELVKNGEVNSEPLKADENTERHSKPIIGTQKIIGFILLTVGLLGALLSLAVNPAIIFPSGYLLLCGIICLVTKKHGGLVIAWFSFLLAAFLMPRITATNMNVIFNWYYYQETMLLHLVVAYAMWIFAVILVVITARLFFKGHILLALGWLLFSQIYGFVPLMFRSEVPAHYRLFSCGVILLMLALLFFTAKILYTFIKNRKEST